MERHDVHLLPYGIVVVLRDARVLGGNAHRAAPGVVALGLAGARARLGHHEAAAAVAQVHKLEQVEIGLDERVLAADAAVGPSRPTKAGASWARTMTYSTSPSRTTSRRPGSSSSAWEARGREGGHGLAKERALGDGDADGAAATLTPGVTTPGLARLAEDLLQALEREGKAAGREPLRPRLASTAS